MPEVSIDNLTLGERLRLIYHRLRYQLQKSHEIMLREYLFGIMIDRFMRGEIPVEMLGPNFHFHVDADDGSEYILPITTTLEEAEDFMRKLHEQAGRKVV